MKPDIGSESQFLPTPHAFDAPMTFGMEKLEWCGYPIVQKSLTVQLFVLIESTNVTDTHTHT